MKITDPQIKAFIADILTFEDSVEGNGQPVRRKYYTRDHVAGVHEAKKVITAGMLIGYIAKDKDPKTALMEEVVWFPPEVRSPELKAVTEKHTEAELELSQAALNAIKFYYQMRRDITEISPEKLEEFEVLVGVKQKAA